MAENIKITRDLRITRENLRVSFNKNLENSNKSWNNVLNLILSLSSSALVITIALSEKLFPSFGGGVSLPKWLAMSWVSLSVAIIFGIISQVDEAIFYGNLANKEGFSMNNIDCKLSAGVLQDQHVIKNEDNYIIYNDILFGTVSVNAFLFGILFMCLSFLCKIFSRNICLGIFIFFCVALVIINWRLISKISWRQINK